MQASMATVVMPSSNTSTACWAKTAKLGASTINMTNLTELRNDVARQAHGKTPIDIPGLQASLKNCRPITAMPARL